MAKLSLTRRSFLKAAAVTGAASTLSFAAAPSAALAEGVDESAGEVKRIRSCCRACGKCECGVWVTVQDNKVIKVEGDESNAHSRGHCCAKSQASMLALYHPDRLRYTMKRTNPKGEDDPGWVRVNFAEAMDEIGAKYNELIDKYGGKSIFSMGGTSRVWAQPPYGTLKSVFGTHNFHSAYEICKGPRHFGGVLTDEKGSPWMEVEQGPIVYVQWGTASEYSNYDSTNRTVVDCSQRAYKHILVDPRMSPLGKEADLWLPIRVGTDLAMSLGWLKWIVDNDAYDKNFVKRWSNGPFLYNPEADGKTYKGYFLEMNGGIHMTSRLLTEADLDREWVSQFWEPAPEQYSYRRFICWDAANEKPTYWDAEECQWEGEKHKIPTTGTWIEHPYKPIIADAWLPDPSKFADPADPAYDAYWTGEGNEKGAKSNPKGLPKDPELWPDGVQVKLANGKMIEAKSVWQEWEHNLEEYTLRARLRDHRGSRRQDRRGGAHLHHAPEPASRQRRHPLPAGPRPDGPRRAEHPRPAAHRLSYRQLRRARRQPRLLEGPGGWLLRPRKHDRDRSRPGRLGHPRGHRHHGTRQHAARSFRGGPDSAHPELREVPAGRELPAHGALRQPHPHR